MKYCPQCKSDLIKFNKDNINRLVCSADNCEYIFWNNPVPVVAGIIQYNNKIILARNSQWPENIFSMITGFLEKDEHPESAILREAQEELGLNCQIQQFIGHYSFNEMNQIILAYWLKTYDDTSNLSTEISEIKQVDRNKLSDYDFGKFHITKKIVDDGLQLTRHLP